MSPYVFLAAVVVVITIVNVVIHWCEVFHIDHHVMYDEECGVKKCTKCDRLIPPQW